MNNELGRKITSLTLMTIMLAGGMTFAVPGMMPAAHAANETLFVSAENVMFQNYFYGAQVIEIVVSDPLISALDDILGSPDVEVNGDDVVMTQASDGSWYAYIADTDFATEAESRAAGQNLNFGISCTAATASEATIDTGAALGAQSGPVYFSGDTAATGFTTTDPSTDGNPAACDDNNTEDESATTQTYLIKGAKTLNSGPGTVTIGQIGLIDTDLWPFIQTYNFNPTGSVVVEYNKAGPNETVTLTFDVTDGVATFGLDRTTVPKNAQIHATAGDPMLNLDPTSSDLWEWTVAGVPSYREGATVTSIGNLGFGLNGAFKVTGNNSVLELEENADTGTSGTATDSIGVFETGANTSIFTTTDDADKSTVFVSSTALRGQTGTLDYNDTPTSVVVGHAFATIDMDASSIGDEWNSGESLPVTLFDPDQNLNTLADEDLDLNNPAVTLVPSLKIGSPQVLISSSGTGNTPSGSHIQAVSNVGVTVDTFGKIARVSSTSFSQDTATTGAGITTGTTLTINAGITVATLRSFVAADGTNFVYLNYDVRSLVESAPTALRITDEDGTSIFQSTTVTALNDADATQALVLLKDAVSTATTDDIQASGTTGLVEDDDVIIEFTGAADFVDVTINDPFVVDFFSFGDRTNNAIYRLELEETGDNTSTFVGTVEYIMTNQLNQLATTYNGIVPILDEVVIIVTEDLTDEDGPRINYLDLGSDGVSTQISDQEDAPTHSGVVDLDLDTYKIADTIVITLTDQDLNVNSDLIDTFTAQKSGKVDNLTYVTAPLTHLLDVTFNDVLYTKLGSTDGFVLIETGPATGVFTGSFQIPAVYDLDGFGGNSIATPIDSVTGGGDSVNDTFRLNDPTNTADNTVNSYTVGQVITATLVADSDSKATHTLVADDIDSEGNLVDDILFTITSLGTTDAVFDNGQTVTIAETTATGTTTGTDIEVNYNDHRDASGEEIEVGDGAGIRANTGSISLDRTVYPVPWGTFSNFETIASGKTPNSFSIFPIHATGITGVINETAEQIKTGAGDVIIHVRISDPDLDLSAAGEDVISANTAASEASSTIDDHGPVKITVSRGTSQVTLAYAGGEATDLTGGIIVGSDPFGKARLLGEIQEVAGNTGVFELDFAIKYTDGPSSTLCPQTTTYSNLEGGNTVDVGSRFKTATESGGVVTLADATLTGGSDFCILQGDILTVQYTDATDASGNVNTVTDSATFDLRNGVLQSDKSVYIIGSDMIITVIEPDWDLDNDSAETYDLDVIEWDSDAATTTMGNKNSIDANTVLFDPEPSALRETGDSTGIFQIVVEIPASLDGDNLERGEQITLEYTDWGPSGARYVGEENEDMKVTVYTSNFGATVELDQKVYTWTDKVYITIVAPDHNFDSNLVDTIGETEDDSIKITTRSFDIDRYSLVETGTDTGIFTGEVILTGFAHDEDGDGDPSPPVRPGQATSADGSGPTDGFLETNNDDGITVSFEFSEDETVVGSALIRWNIGEVQWLEASYPASGTGVIRTIDPDMNLNPEAVDNFSVDIWSDSDAGGISLTVTETNEATGIFEGTVFFTTSSESSGSRLRVAEGDTVTAEYEDNTLPAPYTRADELNVTATTLIGTVVPPLERAPAANLRTVDAFGNSLDTVSVDQQVQITADLANGQDREQAFAYLVQIQDGNGVTVSLAWITGSLSSGQSFSPALSWIPTQSGTYTATAFVWESVDNPTALSPPVSTTITVN